MNNIQKEFSRNAKFYNEYNQIQKNVVHDLLSMVKDSPEHILDIGAGRGEVYSQIGWPVKSFVAFDVSREMCTLHQKGANVETLQGDFNDRNAFDVLKNRHFDRIISASALQWSRDLERTFAMIASLNAPVALALFTSKTFATLFKTAGLEPLLRSSDEIIQTAKPYFGDNVKLIEYRLSFESKREMFRYIKRSGVSAGRNVLNYKETKRLMERYPLEYLEFEVLFIVS